MQQFRTRMRQCGRVLGLIGLGVVALASARGALAGESEVVGTATALPLGVPLLGIADGAAAKRLIGDSLLGRSRKLRARLLAPSHPLDLPLLTQMFGDSALRIPGIYALTDSAIGATFSFITMLPFSSKELGRVGSYRLGSWPGERRQARSEAYGNPEGFIRVTPENQDTPVSEHFRLRDFLTHDQQAVWPKYLVLREDLVDKLELVIADLEANGVPVHNVRVMSGFRTPQYNARGVRRGGRASDSRHQYGDAADIFVDNNSDGRMDDLNRDGRVDTRDAQVIVEAVERVERSHPELVGGAGLYRATRAHGPFAHIDVRGHRARWGRA